MRYTVVCSQRHEGPYLVEWVTWYRMLGFTGIVVVSNDCTDRSPQLLDALMAAGWITHLRHDVPDGRRITALKLQAAFALPAVRRADWVFVCDVDEFLVVHAGNGGVADLIGSVAEPFLGMSVNWRVFGTSGRTQWEDGLTHRQFVMAAADESASAQWIKSLHSHPEWFRRLGEHGPRGLRLGAAGKDWGALGMRWVNSEGQTVPQWTPDGDYVRRLPAGLTTHRVAQVNHYMVRSTEAFGLKRGTSSPVAQKDRYTAEYFRIYNRNETKDLSALDYSSRFDALHAEAMALPGVSRLHHLCCADYVARLAGIAGSLPQDDPRWRTHLDRAETDRTKTGPA